ncbi:hypothetical protein C8J57DRAFT_1714886 [Mycena rebaudengoi]|nr:hypothetical protein C8J57DRAFT_1714886 [Mycena rebaudengoi]
MPEAADECENCRNARARPDQPDRLHQTTPVNTPSRAQYFPPTPRLPAQYASPPSTFQRSLSVVVPATSLRSPSPPLLPFSPLHPIPRLTSVTTGFSPLWRSSLHLSSAASSSLIIIHILLLPSSASLASCFPRILLSPLHGYTSLAISAGVPSVLPPRHFSRSLVPRPLPPLKQPTHVFSPYRTTPSAARSRSGASARASWAECCARAAWRSGSGRRLRVMMRWRVTIACTTAGVTRAGADGHDGVSAVAETAFQSPPLDAY